MSRLSPWKLGALLALAFGYLGAGPLPVVDLASTKIPKRGGSESQHETRHVEPASPKVESAGKIAEEPLAIREPDPDDFQNVIHERLYLVKSQGYVHAGQYVVPGYYTLMLFSSAWCLPCKELRKEAPALLDKYRNLVIVDIDIGDGDELDPMGASLLADLGEKATLPAALLFNPFGLYMNRQEPSGVASAICGYEEILTRIEAAMKKRKNRRVIPMDGGIVRAKLSELQEEGRHYSLQRPRKIKRAG